MATRSPPAHLNVDGLLAQLSTPPSPTAASHAAAPVEWETYECELVTPLFGGGVEAGKVDHRMPIRASAIRGQLRFWWRLLARHRDDLSPTDLRRAEHAVWGGIANRKPQASRVWVRVQEQPSVTEECPFDYGSGSRFPPTKPWAGKTEYALFPARRIDNQRQTTPEKSLGKPPIRWMLCLGWEGALDDAQRQRVRDALRWWASFGGVGARTRRGLGAVSVYHDGALLPPVTEEEARAAGCVLVMRAQHTRNAVAAWEEAVRRLQTFRQGPDVGRNRGSAPQRPGRSRWPEPDGIRQITRQHAREHPPQHPAAERAWPRAYFGLPIIFHFKDRGEPKDHSLQPKDHDRLASPLVLRPMRKPGDEQRWYPGALLLPYAHVRRLALTLKGQAETVIPAEKVWPRDSAGASQMAQQIPPLAPHADAGDPLQAFMRFFVELDTQRGGRA